MDYDFDKNVCTCSCATSARSKVEKLRAENGQLRKAANDAFYAMIDFREDHDLECFQDAIDKLGLALSEREE